MNNMIYIFSGDFYPYFGCLSGNFDEVLEYVCADLCLCVMCGLEKHERERERERLLSLSFKMTSDLFMLNYSHL